MKGKSNYTISGPGVHETRESADLGLSFAITLASSRAHARIESTFYVRDENENTVGRTESFTDGSVNILGPKHFPVAA